MESAIRRWIDDSVWRQEIKRAETGGLDFLERHEIEKMGREDARELDGLFRYASNMFAPQRLVNSIRINADLCRLRYAGATGVAAANRDHELARFVALAEREMQKKVKLAN